jgi:hypothetical protein
VDQRNQGKEPGSERAPVDLSTRKIQLTRRPLPKLWSNHWRPPRMWTVSQASLASAASQALPVL